MLFKKLHSDIHLCPCVLFAFHFLPPPDNSSNSQLSVWGKIPRPGEPLWPTADYGKAGRNNVMIITTTPTVLSSLNSQPVCALEKVMDFVESVAEYTSLLIRMSTSSSVSISDSWTNRTVLGNYKRDQHRLEGWQAVRKTWQQRGSFENSKIAILGSSVWTCVLRHLIRGGQVLVREALRTHFRLNHTLFFSCKKCMFAASAYLKRLLPPH